MVCEDDSKIKKFFLAYLNNCSNIVISKWDIFVCVWEGLTRQSSRFLFLSIVVGRLILVCLKKCKFLILYYTIILVRIYMEQFVETFQR